MNKNPATKKSKRASTIACARRPHYITRKEIDAWLKTPESLAALAECKDMEVHPEKYPPPMSLAEYLAWSRSL